MLSDVFNRVSFGDVLILTKLDVCGFWVLEKLSMWTYFGALHMLFRNLRLMSLVFAFYLADHSISINYSGIIGANFLM